MDEAGRDHYASEVDSVSRTLKRPGLWLLHGAYLFGCTALADDTAHGPRLRHTLGWPFPGLGRLGEVRRQCGAAGECLNVTWPGFVGVLTAVAPKRFAASINQAPMRRRWRPRACGAGEPVENNIRCRSALAAWSGRDGRQ